MTSKFKNLPESIYIDNSGRVSSGFRFGTWCDVAHVDGSIQYIRKDFKPEDKSLEQQLQDNTYWRIGWAIKHMGYWSRLWWALTGKNKFMNRYFWEEKDV